MIPRMILPFLHVFFLCGPIVTAHMVRDSLIMSQDKTPLTAPIPPAGADIVITNSQSKIRIWVGL